MVFQGNREEVTRTLLGMAFRFSNSQLGQEHGECHLRISEARSPAGGEVCGMHLKKKERNYWVSKMMSTVHLPQEQGQRLLHLIHSEHD